MALVEYSLHWLSVSIRRVNVDLIIAALQEFVKSPWEYTNRGGYGFVGYYEHHLTKSRIYVDHESDHSLVSVQLNGQFMEMVDQRALVRVLGSMGARATRLDYAFDGVDVTPAQFRELWLSGSVTSLVKRSSWSWYSSPDGDTFYIGSPSSGRRCRVYNRRGLTRIEVQNRSDRAAIIFDDLYQIADSFDFRSCLLAHLQDYFKIAALWFDDLVGSVSPACARLPDHDPDTSAWLRRCVGPALRRHVQEHGPVKTSALIGVPVAGQVRKVVEVYVDDLGFFSNTIKAE